MRSKAILTGVVIVFALFCFFLIADTGILSGQRGCEVCIPLQSEAAAADEGNQGEAEKIEEEKEEVTSAKEIQFTADNSKQETVVIGGDPNEEDHKKGFKYQLKLINRGASVVSAIFTDGKGTGFDDRDVDNPQPLKLLSPIFLPPDEVHYSFANRELVLEKYGQQFPLDKLNWEISDVEKNPNTHKVSFNALIKTVDGNDVIKVTKTYTVEKSTYLMKCNLSFENMMDDDETIRFAISGPGGVSREGFRSDMRKVMSLFQAGEGKFNAKEYQAGDFEEDNFYEEKPLMTEEGKFLWAATANKYFSAIMVPVPGQAGGYERWILSGKAQYYNPDVRKRTEDEHMSFDLKSREIKLAKAGDTASSRGFEFEIYLGPKDRTLFSENEHYKELGFFNTVDFRTCCCPQNVINPLSFGILAAMNWIYSVIPNYGIAIMILVFIIRLIIHPLTKKSQVNMQKFSKLGPQIQELKDKYGDNQKELNKRMMALYKEQGASPFMGMLPMVVQLPIWIALYTAIYSSVELRGAPFLPFWITDLSVPDALIRFQAFSVPIFGKIQSFNLLPVLMGVAFFLQQKMMPSSAAANPQAETQQKMMKIMMPILFPLLFYKMPSGLNLYIMSSVFAGVIEQHVIRKHLRQQEEAEKEGKVPVTKKTGGKKKKKKPKPFFKNK